MTGFGRVIPIMFNPGSNDDAPYILGFFLNPTITKLVLDVLDENY
jgi:hypothetical protein